MKKKLGNILIFVLIIGLTIGYGIYKDSQSTVTVNKIYTMEFQEQALSDLENEKGNGNYTLQNIFMKYNHFQPIHNRCMFILIHPKWLKLHIQ